MHANVDDSNNLLASRVILRSNGEDFSYNVRFERAIRLVIEERSGPRQKNAVITFLQREYGDLHIEQIRLLYEEL